MYASRRRPIEKAQSRQRRDELCNYRRPDERLNLHIYRCEIPLWRGNAVPQQAGASGGFLKPHLDKPRGWRLCRIALGGDNEDQR